jgi:hypothetical protein
MLLSEESSDRVREPLANEHPFAWKIGVLGRLCGNFGHTQFDRVSASGLSARRVQSKTDSCVGCPNLRKGRHARAVVRRRMFRADDPAGLPVGAPLE